MLQPKAQPGTPEAAFCPVSRNYLSYDRCGKGKYTEPFGHPLTEDQALESYTPPDPTRVELYA